MAQCPACTSTIAEESRYCPQCGSPVDVSVAVTRPERHPNSRAGSRDRRTRYRSWSDSSARSGEFTAGQVINDRYRIEALLGRGGMGDVYRAEDLKLGQVVALKFLQADLSHDPERLNRFLDEVRVARSVSHPNVCRVYDIGEVEGRHFLSMEYIAGEDLGGLLRRIGRLPEDKALDISRQLCAGLAAAHKQGILHRDLKPANIMLDSDGMVRITDFGLASLIEDTANTDVRSGTPAYMSPEQLRGVEVSTRSDIFSLGLVLYEIFTGKRVFDAKTFEQLTSLHETPRVSPRELNQRLDAAVDRVILNCLESDPERRPESALQVAAALPGGDPLAAALMAGETPSPELVAAAGSTGKMAPFPAIVCLLTIVTGCAILLALTGSTLVERASLSRSPAALADTAQALLHELEYEQPATDSAHGFTINSEYLEYVDENDSSPERWEKLDSGNPAGIYYWYRQSPRPLAPLRGSFVRYDDPPLLFSGMARIQLAPDGRLLELEISPAEERESTARQSSVDWAFVFSKAGLDLDHFQEVDSHWIPPVFADQRKTWVSRPEAAKMDELRVEAGAFQGRVVYFHPTHPWTRESRIESDEPTAAESVSSVLGILMAVAIAIGSILLARRNIKKGRGDLAGAFRVSICFLLLNQLAWSLRAHHVADLYEEGYLLVRSLAFNLFFCCLIWLLYVSLEPYLRRRWPEGVISWSRLLTGHLRDPLIGRDLLIGSSFGITLGVLVRGSSWLSDVLGSTPSVPRPADVTYLLGAGDAFANLLDHLFSAVLGGLVVIFMLFLMRLLLRKDWLALAAVFTLVVFQNVVSARGMTESLIAAVLILAMAWCLVVFLLLRFGLLAGMAGLFSGNFLLTAPLTTDVTVWYSGATVLAIGAILILAGYGFAVSVDRTQFAIGDLD